MRKSVKRTIAGLAAAAGILMLAAAPSCKSEPDSPTGRKTASRTEKILAAYEQGRRYGRLTVLYPLDETLFPPEIVPPTFRWRDGRDDTDEWLVTLDFQDGRGRINARADRTEWTPSDDQWGDIKQYSGVSRAIPMVLEPALKSKVYLAKYVPPTPTRHRGLKS